MQIYISKCEKYVEVDFDNLPLHVKQHLIEYGLTQKLNDCHSAEKDPEVAFGLVENLLERLISGDLSKRAVGRSPIEQELDSMLRTVAKAKTGRKAGDIAKLAREDILALLANALDKPAERILEVFRAKAEEITAEKARQQAELLSTIDLD